MNIDSAIMTLEDMISGADEDRGRDTRISEVIRVLQQYREQQQLVPDEAAA